MEGQALGSDLANEAFDTHRALEMVSPSSFISHLSCRVSLLEQGTEPC